MKSISISNKIRENLPELVLGIIEADVVVEHSSDALLREMNKVIEDFSGRLVVADLKNLPSLDFGRKAYRTLGKDPTKYRISSEKLLRRAIKGQGVMSINNVVDASNIVSMVSGHSVGTYDCNKVSDKLVFTVGVEGESYQSLGSQSINLEGMPIFKDRLGPFGSSTTDSFRSIVDGTSSRIVMNIIAFSGEENLLSYMRLAEKLLIDYCNAKEIVKQIIK